MRSRGLITLFAVLIIALCVTFAGTGRRTPSLGSTVVIADDGGGIITNYIAKYQGIAASDDSVIIDRYCGSACTLFGIVPRNRVCVTRNAVLGYHGAWGHTFLFFGRVELPANTELMWRHYSPDVRVWINQHGGISSSRVMRLMRYPETAKHFRICGTA